MLAIPTLKNFMILWISDKDNPDLTPRQLCILLAVYEKKQNHTIKSLTETLAMTKPTVSRAVDKLIELGLLQKSKALKDRRIIIVDRTFQGECLMDKVNRYLNAANENYYTSLFRTIAS